MSDEKPIEFWITKSRRAYDSEGDLLPSDEVRIHVIEYSAYEKLREQLAVAVEALSKFCHEPFPSDMSIKTVGDVCIFCGGNSFEPSKVLAKLKGVKDK